MNIFEQYSNYNHYDYNNPKYLVIHYVGAQSSTAKNNADYFCGGDRQASAHEFVDDNDCYRVIKESQGAWHVGNTQTEVNNQNSIGIEMCCFGSNLGVTEKTENNAVERAAYYMKKYNIPLSNLRTHYEVSGKTKVCPNWNANNWDRWNNFKEKVKNKLDGKAMDVIYASHVEGIGWQGDKKNGETSGTTGQGKRLEAFTVRLSDESLNNQMKIQGHIQNIGDTSPINGGQILGTMGRELRLESLKIDSPIKLLYRVHIQNKGWSNLVESGNWCGTKGEGLRIEAIEIKIA